MIGYWSKVADQLLRCCKGMIMAPLDKKCPELLNQRSELNQQRSADWRRPGVWLRSNPHPCTRNSSGLHFIVGARNLCFLGGVDLSRGLA
mmetsp:Transcript_54591/g.111416  ORF Transcript_54591/g.111416 Transcript_54591/m.111416 type:complete len:90 (-) Transcript_54591:72-341(-)